MNSVYVVVWKELKDMLRDIRTLAAIAFLPLLILPLMSLTSIYAQGLQPGYVALINYDKTSGSVGGVNITSEDILEEISKALEKTVFT